MSGLDRAGAELTIDLAAIRRNYWQLNARLDPDAELGAVVKADAYGLGVSRIAPTLAQAGCKTYFVATLDEGIALRAAVEDATIYVLNGLVANELEDFFIHRLRPVLNTMGQIERWYDKGQVANKTSVSAALHVDTGMNRLGISTQDVGVLASGPYKYLSPSLLMSHLACAEEVPHPLNRIQLARFSNVLEVLRPNFRNGVAASFANSSGIFLGSDFHFDLVRAGAALFGINPIPSQANCMSEVLNLKAKIMQVRRVDSPMTVGYGAAHRVKESARIATVPVGYADGFIRSLGGRASAYVGSFCVPVIGRVSMDAITLDVSTVPEDLAQPGAIVDLIGGRRALDDVAGEAGTIGYEMLTRISDRIPRIYLDRAE
ncbi:MAG TPA: alanine racemase [Alphaproteobacteria bacterium]|jgi:alanine racemase|nr:alanine racemase [Alphaproteobacteria bacterium]